MRQQQFIRFVQQICYLLKLSQPCSKTALQYFMQFKEYQNHGYDQEILVASCIYLSVKIFQEDVRIRDILNMVYVLTSLYRISSRKQEEDGEKKREGKKKEGNRDEEGNKKKQSELIIAVGKQQSVGQGVASINSLPQQQSNKSQNKIQQQEAAQQQQQQQQQQPYILLKNIQHQKNLHQLIQPKYSLSQYNQYKQKIISAQQMLLRILGFSFNVSEENRRQLKRLLLIIDYMRMPSTIGQTIIKVYNDMHYIKIDYWAEGVVYFGYLVAKAYAEEKGGRRARGKEVVVVEKENVKGKEENAEGKEVEMIIEIDQIPHSQQAPNNNSNPYQPFPQNLNNPSIINPQPQQQQPITHQHKKSPHHHNNNNNNNNKQQTQLKQIQQFINKMTQSKWQSLLSTTIIDLENYALKLANFYQRIMVQ